MNKTSPIRACALLALAALLGVVAACGGGGGSDPADASAAISPQGLSAQTLSALSSEPGGVSMQLNQVASDRVNRTTFDYKFSVTFTAGSSALVNAVGHVTSSAPGTVVIDGDVNIGSLAAGAVVTPADTITIRQDLTKAFNPASLAWNIIQPSVGPLVQLGVTVSDTGAPSGTVSYRWRSTDGNIVDVNEPTTSWTLPPGRGLHFAYVLVSNNQGGITERRVAVNTDTIGAPIVVPTPVSYEAPATPIPVGNTFRSFFGGGDGELPLIIDQFGFPVAYETFLPDLLVYMKDPNTGITFPAGGEAAPVKTDLQGQYVIHGVLPNIDGTPISYDIYCSPDNGATWARCYGHDGPSADYVMTGNISEHVFQEFPVGAAVVGRFRLSDDSICGTRNEFFGTEITAIGTLLASNGATIAGPVRLSKDGDFSFAKLANAATARITCQSATPQLYAVGTTINGSGNLDVGLKVAAGLKAPVVSNMTATLSGTQVGLFLPPPTGFPSDNVPDPERFLSYKGIDSRLSACQYYKAIGAVKGCDAKGNFVGAINVEDWKKKVKIGDYATAGTTEYSAVYINQVDLNLTRNQHSISYSDKHTAAYVCNHLGPPSLDSTQAEINTAIANAVAGKNLVACVMMDSIATPGVNGGQPYTTFLIFGPSGELLPSINLDGRREKFVPGVCVACHGGDKYAGRFPEDGTGGANIGAHFLPYDIGNFAFSTTPGLTRADQELQLYHLNQNVLKAGATKAATDLIAGWYQGGSTTQDTNYLPPSWVGKGHDDVYHKVYAHSCRTCHVNLNDVYGQYNFDNFDNTGSFAETLSCNEAGYHGQHRKWGMPNSLVTFNRFWGTKGTANDLTAIWAAFLQAPPASGSPPGSPPACQLVRLP